MKITKKVCVLIQQALLFINFGSESSTEAITNTLCFRSFWKSLMEYNIWIERSLRNSLPIYDNGTVLHILSAGQALTEAPCRFHNVIIVNFEI